MNVGAEPKKVVILAVLGVMAGFLVIQNLTSDGDGVPPAPTSSRPTPVARGVQPVPARDIPTSSARTSRGRTAQEFRPSLKPKRGEAAPDPTTIDPTLRLDVLAKLQTVNVEGTRRSIFEFGQAPPPKPTAEQVAAAEKAKVPSPLVEAAKAEPEKETTPAKPEAPPIPLKFYGYISPSNEPERRAFFMEGEDIHVVSEGQTVKSRYKIVRIGINSVVVEDTQFGSQQTLPLEEQQG